MDDEPILDCIVVAARTDRSSTMAPSNEPSASPRPDAGKVGNAARGVPKQSQTSATSSSGSTAANPPSRRMPEKKTAVPGGPSKGLPPAPRAAPGAKRPPAFPSIRPPASRSQGYASFQQWLHKRNHDDAFPSNSNRDLGQQPAQYNKDRSKDDENPGQAESQHNSARFEVISISSDNDEDLDSDDEPLARRRKATSGTPNPSGRQQKKQASANIPSRPSSTAPNAHIPANTSQKSHAESRPSTAQEGLRAGHGSRTSSEYRADTGISEGGQGIESSKRLRTDLPKTYDCFLRNIGSRTSPNISGVAEGPRQVHASADDLGKDRVSATTTRFENENQELKAKLEQQVTENQALAKQLRESRALSKGSNQSNLASEWELSLLREELGARGQQIKLLISEKVSLHETITQLRDEATQEKEDANQSLISRQNHEDELQKLLDDQVTRCMSLEATVKGLQRKEDSSKDTASEITKLQATNRELREKNTQQEGENSRMKGETTELKEQYSKLKEEKDEIMAMNGRIQKLVEELEQQLEQKSAEHALAAGATKTQIEELQQQVSSQRDEIKEYERRNADLHEEVDWYEGNRERMKKEWDERVAMEMKWRDDLLAAINNSNLSLAESRRRLLAAPDPIQQAAQRDAQRNAALQQPAQQQPAQRQPVQSQPAQQQPSQRQPAQRQPAQRHPARQQTTQQQTAQQRSVQQRPVQQQPVQQQPAQQQPAQQQPGQRQPAQRQSAPRQSAQPRAGERDASRGESSSGGGSSSRGPR